MVRSEWLSLNGIWDYMEGKDMINPKEATIPPTFTNKAEKIRVPFCPESDLSGIARDNETNLWYKRNIIIPKEWRNKRVLLNFEAVDRIATIFVNGKKVGSHIGGYNAFSFDITDLLKAENNTLDVGAYDPNDGKAACKKNGDKGDYTFTSGI